MRVVLLRENLVISAVDYRGGAKRVLTLAVTSSAFWNGVHRRQHCLPEILECESTVH
jgi:hypothetical protein